MYVLKSTYSKSYQLRSTILTKKPGQLANLDSSMWFLVTQALLVRLQSVGREFIGQDFVLGPVDLLGELQ